MTKSNTQAKRDERARKRAAGMVRKDVWVYPSQWSAIQAYCQKKAKEGLKELMK